MEKVIVVITTYNLKDYIAKALDSVLAQKTSFEFKIHVADDASTDGTVEILKEYQDRYPEKMKLLLAEKNMGSLANSNRVFDKIDCEYFTFLDGDDYWVGEDRLQKQVDFLDSHKEYAMVGGNTQFLKDDVLGEMIVPEKLLGKSYGFDDMIQEKMPFVHTSAILVRNTIFKKGLPACYVDTVDTFENCALRGEDFRRMLHLEKGLMYVMPEVVSVYRIHQKGIWQGSKEIHRKIEAVIGANFYYKYYGNRHGEYFARNLRHAYLALKTELKEQECPWELCALDRRDCLLLGAVLADMSEHREELSQWDQHIKTFYVKRTVKDTAKGTAKNILRRFGIRK